MSETSKTSIRFHQDVVMWHRGLVDPGPDPSDRIDGKGMVFDVAMWFPDGDYGRLVRMKNLGDVLVEVDRGI